MPQMDPLLRLLLITGFLGALTTFSTFSAEVIAMLQNERYALALGMASLHLFGSLLLTLAGIKSALFLIAARAHQTRAKGRFGIKTGGPLRASARTRKHWPAWLYC